MASEHEQALERQAARQREAEHRVKNTLQLISSIVMLQGRRAADETARHALRAVQQRVAAVSVAHRHVSWRDEAEEVELASLIREIVSDLAGSAGREGVEIDLDLESVTIPGRHGAPVALLVNEAVGNALRHAYPEGHNGRIDVRLRRTADGFGLEVTDSGVGFDPGAPKAGFGMTVAQLMCQQLKGRMETKPGNPGVCISVSVPMDRQPSRA